MMGNPPARVKLYDVTNPIADVDKSVGEEMEPVAIMIA